jgi:hypothetical protein
MSNRERTKTERSRRSDRAERISTAPLHVACKNRRWVSSSKLDELREKFPFLDTSKWTKKEKKQLKANWKHIVYYYPDYSDPRFAFGVGHDNESHLSTEEVDDRKRKYTDFNIMLRLAYGLENRLICDIYMKCRRMFYERSFYFHSRDRVPAELAKRVKFDLRMNESPQIIADKYNIAPSVIDTIRRRPTSKKKFKWTPSAVECLRQSVIGVHNVFDLDKLLARNIDWGRVRDHMESYDYEVSKEQCYNKWIRLNPSSKRGRYQD